MFNKYVDVDIRGLFKKYPIFDWEKYIYRPGLLQP